MLTAFAHRRLFHDTTPTTGLASGWTRYGENVGGKTANAAAIFQAFLNSPGHKAIIVGSYTHIGVGYSGERCGARANSTFLTCRRYRPLQAGGGLSSSQTTALGY